MNNPTLRNGKRMMAIPLTAMTTNAIESLSQEDLTAALSLTNTQASTDLTIEDIQAALTLIKMSTSSTDRLGESIRESNHSPASNKGQASGTDSQQPKSKKRVAAYQRQWRAKLPEGHRKAEYQRFKTKETDSHREERLRKKRERKRAKSAEAKRVQLR